MSHLGSRISALVDGQLSVVATERALAHVAGCAACAEELAAARRARAALSGWSQVPEPPSDLTARLMSLAGPEPRGPRPSRDPFAPPNRHSGSELAAYGVARRRLPSRLLAGTPFGTHALHGDVAGRQVSRLVVGSVASMGAVAAMLFALGDRPDVAPERHLAADLETLRGVTTTASAPLTVGGGDGSAGTTVEWLRAHGWTFPAGLPAGWAVQSVGWSEHDGRVLEVALDGPEGTFVVTEQQGRLDAGALADAGHAEVGGRDVYVLSFAPWHIAWQADSTVVQVIGDGPDAAEDLVAAFPAGAFDDGVPARMQRGWTTVAGVLDR